MQTVFNTTPLTHTQGKNEECATGQWCFIDIDCPTTEVLKPYADTSSSSGGGGGRGGGKRNKKPKQQEEQLEQRNSDTDSDGRNGSGGRSGGTNNSRNGSDKHIIGKCDEMSHGDMKLSHARSHNCHFPYPFPQYQLGYYGKSPPRLFISSLFCF